MAVVLMEYVNEFVGSSGTVYEARACAREREDGLWEGWIEFTPSSGGETIATGRVVVVVAEQDRRTVVPVRVRVRVRGSFLRPPPSAYSLGSVTPCCPWYFPFLSLYDVSGSSSPWKKSSWASPSFE